MTLRFERKFTFFSLTSLPSSPPLLPILQPPFEFPLLLVEPRVSQFNRLVSPLCPYLSTSWYHYLAELQPPVTRHQVSLVPIQGQPVIFCHILTSTQESFSLFLCPLGIVLPRLQSKLLSLPFSGLLPHIFSKWSNFSSVFISHWGLRSECLQLSYSPHSNFTVIFFILPLKAEAIPTPNPFFLCSLITPSVLWIAALFIFSQTFSCKFFTLSWIISVFFFIICFPSA